MREQNLAVGYEFYGSIRDAGGQQLVCLFYPLKLFPPEN